MKRLAIRFLASTATMAFALGVPVDALQAQQQTELRLDDLDAATTKILQSGLWGNETGVWRTKIQLMIDPATRVLTRRMVTIWGPEPSKKFDFTWAPVSEAKPDSAVVFGAGRLVWRNRELPAYDTSSIVSLYDGGMQNGRPSGHGEFEQVGGVSYVGDWQNGLMHGSGLLKLPNGDEYEGAFFAGRPHGEGRYIDSAGAVYQGAFFYGRREGPAP
jgi:hypothetical protein